MRDKNNEKAALNRYEVQERFPLWPKVEGRQRLSSVTAVVVGVGALGCNSANLLARAGVGRLRLIDPDFPSIQNLHRQTLYTENDTWSGSPKAEVAAKHLRAVNSDIIIESLPIKLGSENAVKLLQGADVVVDGLDNVISRYILNEACHYLGIPWVHGGLVGAYGQVMVIKKGDGPCFRCWCKPDVSESPGLNVNVQGVFSPTPLLVSSIQTSEALKILLSIKKPPMDGLLKIDLISLRFRNINGRFLTNPRCPVCSGNYEHITSSEK